MAKSPSSMLNTIKNFFSEKVAIFVILKKITHLNVQSNFGKKIP